MNNEDMSVDKSVESRPYTLRPLKDKDLYTVLGILDRIFPGDKLKEAFETIAVEGKTAEEIGIQIASNLGLSLVRNIVTAHDEIYALLADVSGIPAEQIDDMPFGTGPMMIRDIVMNARNADFFKAVFRSP
jgi:hypothetical protein